MNPQATRIFELLKYIEDVEKLKRTPTYTVPTELFSIHQSELEGLPELTLNVLSEDQEAWLRLPRMEEVHPPALPFSLGPWVSLSLDLNKPPVLKSSRGAIDGKPADASDLIDSHPDIEALFKWYVEEQWKVWQAAERPRRKSIALYNKLFHLYQLLSTDGAENPVELIWGVGMASWKPTDNAKKVEHPLLTQTCDLRLNERTFALEIGPRQADAKLEIDCYAEMEVPGVLALESVWKEALSKQAASLDPFESSTYEGILKVAVANLDPTGRYEPRIDDFSLPVTSEVLVVTNAWVVFARKRSVDIFLEDVRRLQANLQAGAEVPPVINEFVTKGDDQIRIQPEVSFRGLSSSNSGAGVKELYFPMAYNNEQVAIVAKLENNNGVVVQGPPGTGKTHTIANVICHYLALGKRVLVTSKGDTALSVLQEKLPERIRTLSVSLLSNEQEGMQQFERSIARIAAEVNAVNPGQLQSNIEGYEEQLNQLHAKISDVDQTIAAEAAKNMQTYSFRGKEVTAESLAQLVMDQMDDHGWFEDVLPAQGAGTPPLTDTEIRELRVARAACRKDLAYIGVNLPDIGRLPSWDVLEGLHKDMVRAKEIESVVVSGALYPLKDSSLETFTAASKLLSGLTAYTSSLAAVTANAMSDRLLTRLRDMRADDILLTKLLELKNRFTELDEQRKRILSMAIEVPAGAEKNPNFLEALARLEAGRSAFLFPLGKGDARKLVEVVQVAGAKPDNPEQWRLVRDAINWRISASKDLARLGSMAIEFGLNPVSRDEIELGVREAAQQLQVVGQVHALVFDVERNLYSSVTAVFPENIAAQVGGGRVADIKGLVDSLRAHLDKGRLGYAMGRVAEYVALLEPGRGGITGALRHFLRLRLGSLDGDVDELKHKWLIAVDELKRLTILKPRLAFIEQMSQKLAAGGAPLWAKKLCTEEPSADFDPLLPTNWADAWDWRVASSLIEQLDVHFRMRAHFDERRALTAKLASTYQDAVAERAWLGIYKNSPDSIRQALQSYLTSIQAMGGGTGIRAARHRRNAREAMSEAYRAVPCWILPHWRVSETLPPELGLFDLVIIDEASQSDIWALPALLRGRKLLVVGDEKQVSPSIVGIPEQRIIDIQRRFLDAQPHGKHMAPDMSIYDLSRVVFAGNSVMLREHFRCVSAIIEYSNREFYQGDIQPLRVPKANERLDPPLVDVLVKGGCRQGDKNVGEARAIVNEISDIVDDPAYAGRTIGVVTLLGTEQAKLIHELISSRIPPEVVIARKIVVGPPPMFQGRERDIMMVSMVLQKGNAAAANSLAQQQRFNVALSRARDRTYLFRSVEDGVFNPDSLTGRLLKHFRQPFDNDAGLISASRDLCESGFEREMFDELTRRGYRVKPQVPCGGFRIDFVVEGAEGRRLAVECDGDRYHGPGQWSADMARQRVLERAGWVFWRCFASSFTRRRKEVLNDLFATLSHLGIEPLADAPIENSSWVTSKTADPFGLENKEPQPAEGT